MNTFKIRDNCITAAQFMWCFTPSEMVGIRASDIPEVQEYVRRLDDTRCPDINLKWAAVREGLEMLVANNLLEEYRVDEILQAKVV